MTVWTCTLLTVRRLGQWIVTGVYYIAVYIKKHVFSVQFSVDKGRNLNHYLTEH